MATAAPSAPARTTRFDPGWAALLTAVLVLSLGSTVSKKTGTPGLTLACVRSLMGTIVWQVILAARGRHLTWESLKVSIGPGVLFGANIACFFTAVQHTRVANVEFLGAMGPLVVVPAGAVFFKEHIPWKALVWGVPAIGGVGLVAFLAEHNAKESNAFGLMMAIASIFTWAGYLTVAKRVRPRIDIGEFMAGSAMAAGLVLLPFSLAQGFVTAIPARGWPWLLMLTLSNAVIAHTLLLVAQQHVPIGTISTMQVAQPALAAAAAWLLLGERVNGGQIFGMAIVLTSLALYSSTVQREAFPWQPRPVADTSSR